MPARIDLNRARREELRWLILLALNAARPLGTTEGIVKNAIEPVVLDVTTMEIRNELDYLAERGLVNLDRCNTPTWHAKIKRYGIDVVEYTVECDPGIKRPTPW